MTGRVNSYNSLQKIPQTSVSGVSVIIGTTQVVLYTCPAGKKAIITNAGFESNGGGANTFMRARINVTKFYNIPIANENNLVQVTTMINQEMNAGDTINLIGDNAANNGAAEFYITLTELPI